jgi:branched-chain amino acid transport system permease protein
MAAEFLQFLFSGITIGATYALVGLGFSIIYNASHVINFAQGEFVMLGGMGTVFFLGLGLPMPLAIAAAVAVTVAIGLLLEKLAIEPARDGSVVTLIIITIGASIFLRGGAQVVLARIPLVAAVLGRDPYRHRRRHHPATEPVGAGRHRRHGLPDVALLRAHEARQGHAGHVLQPAGRPPGRHQRAHGPDAELHVGGTARRHRRRPGGTPFGDLLRGRHHAGLKGFCAAILGGLGRGWGAVAGGLILGIAEAMGAGYVSSDYKDAIAFVIILLVLFFMPSGLFGRRETERV